MVVNTTWKENGPGEFLSRPIPSPGVAWNSSPRSILDVADAWVPFLNGAIKQLLREESWNLATKANRAWIVENVDQILAAWTPKTTLTPPDTRFQNFYGSDPAGYWLLDNTYDSATAKLRWVLSGSQYALPPAKAQAALVAYDRGNGVNTLAPIYGFNAYATNRGYTDGTDIRVIYWLTINDAAYTVVDTTGIATLYSLGLPAGTKFYRISFLTTGDLYFHVVSGKGDSEP